MTTKISTIFLLAIALTIGSCAAKKAIVLSQTDADRAAATFPGATLASLTEGKRHYEENCGSCHGLKKVTSENEAGWRKIVPDMAQKAEIDAKKEDLILQYVVTMSKMP
jgi:cytochrome c5